MVINQMARGSRTPWILTPCAGAVGLAWLSVTAVADPLLWHADPALSSPNR